MSGITAQMGGCCSFFCAEYQGQTEPQLQPQTEAQAPPQPQTEAQTEKVVKKADSFVAITKVKHSEDNIKLEWEPVLGAEGYDIFASMCGRKIPSEPTMTVTGTKAVLKKAHGKSQYYKVDAA